IELVVGSYMMYSSDTETERLVEQIEKLDFVKKESKFDDLKIGERVYTLSNNDFENNYFRFSLCGLKYLETEFDQN
ncbi:MAG: hypothetical protein IJ272_07435, partial [Clostridia bacterium]|nr:hypothetical protein [Clostridia bacterium]